ncbi:MAG: ABC transporter permease [Chloroflexota bacterium]|nr:ABC transporter permease [Chloroflexota bacterium]
MEVLRLAAGNLTRRRIRTALTVMGVAIAIAFTVGILSISEGFMTSFEDVVEKQDIDIVVVPKGAAAMPIPDAASAAGDFPDTVVAEIAEIDNVSAVYPTFGHMFIPEVEEMASGGALGGMGMVNGVPDGYLDDVLSYLELNEGVIPQPWEGDVLVVGSGMAEVYLLGIGSVITIGTSDFEVVGILKASGTFDDASYFAPLKAVQEAYGKGPTEEQPGSLNYIAIKVDDVTVAEETALEINEIEGFQSVLAAQTMDSVVDKLGELLGMARSIHFALGAVSLLIGVLFILSTMLMAVSERVREIGTMRAIGVHRSFVFQLIIIEATITSVVAGIFGCIGGIILSRLITVGVAESMGVSYVEAVVTPRILVLGIVIALIMGISAGLYPAWRIAQSNIVKALRYE